MTMEATVTLLRKMAFDTVSGSGHHQLMDAEARVGGENRGPRPWSSSCGACWAAPRWM